MGIRLLLIIFALWALYSIVRRYLVRARKTPVNRRKNVAENMVKCEVCDTYLPEHEALSQNGMFFCSKAHLNRTRHDQ